MVAETTDKLRKRHTGRNVQRVRMYFGVKQEALAADLGISQQEVSRIEQQEEIEEEVLSQIASVLGILLSIFTCSHFGSSHFGSSENKLIFAEIISYAECAFYIRTNY